MTALFIYLSFSKELYFISCSHTEYNNLKLFIYGIRRRFDVNSILSFLRNVIELFKVANKYLGRMKWNARAKPFSSLAKYSVLKLLL